MKFLKFKNIPLPGFRNIKTAISIFLCLILYNIMNREGVALATMASLICMQDSVEKSISEGRNRLIGTIIGGLFGIIFIYLGILKVNTLIYFFMCTLGIIFLIYICTIIKITNSVVIACAVFLIIVTSNISDSFYNSVVYAVGRTIDTIFGIFIAVIVNRLLYKPIPERIKRKRKEKILKINYNIIKSHQYKIYKNDESIDKELFIYPQSSLLYQEKFDFRISLLEILKDNFHFAKYENYMMHILSIKNDIKIEHENFHMINVDTYNQDFFDAQWKTKTIGKGICLNLIYKKGFYGKFNIVKNNIVSNINNKKYTFFVSLEDNLKIIISDSKNENIEEILNKDDIVIINKNIKYKGNYMLNFKLKNNNFSKPVAIKIEIWK